MRYPIYPMKAEETFMSFEFFSEGPKGLIKKRIQFQITHREDLFNLAFGDIDDETNDFDDKAVSNNGDSEKVLATVAAAVFAFLNKYPSAKVYAKGVTPVRTRLYKMGISKNLEDIKEKFEIFGLIGDSFWVECEKNMPYSAFYIQNKNLLQ